MKKLVLMVMIVLVIFSFSINVMAYYAFLSPEANSCLDNLKEKHRLKEIILKKQEGVVWTVILPKNDGVETSKVKEAVYNEAGEFEAIYTFTDITIINPEGWTRIIWGSATDAYPYDVPRICIRFDS